MDDLLRLLPAARQAASLCQRVQRVHIGSARQEDAVRRKEGHEPVTIADYGAQAILCRAIRRLFPDDAIIAEEGGDEFLQLIGTGEREEVRRQVSEAQLCVWLDPGHNRAAERTWVIDPIDGTKGFIALRHYVIAVGLLDASRQVVAGLLAAPGWPGAGRLLYTRAGVALMEPLKGGAASQLQVSRRREPADMLLMESFEPAHTSHSRMQQVCEAAGLAAARIERIDSQEKYGRVAAGQADLYLRQTLPGRGAHRIWDHAAGTALVQAAGGIVSDLDGSALDFSQGPTLARNKGVIAANPNIHGCVVDALRSQPTQ